MTYVIGDASTTNAPPRLQLTCKGDDWYSLGSAYGVEPKFLINMQPQWAGKSFTAKSMQNWIKSLPGWNRDTGIRKYVSSSNPGTQAPDGSPEGWAIFTAKTMLMLPDMPRLDGKVPGDLTKSPAGEAPPAPGVGAAKKKAPILLMVGIGAAILLVATMGGDKKKKPAGRLSTAAA